MSKLAFRCYDPDQWSRGEVPPPEDMKVVLADDAEDAAEDAAEQFDCADSDYPEQRNVTVVDPNGNVTRFEVNAETVRVYRATVLKESEEPEEELDDVEEGDKRRGS